MKLSIGFVTWGRPATHGTSGMDSGLRDHQSDLLAGVLRSWLPVLELPPRTVSVASRQQSQRSAVTGTFCGEVGGLIRS